MCALTLYCLHGSSFLFFFSMFLSYLSLFLAYRRKFGGCAPHFRAERERERKIHICECLSNVISDGFHFEFISHPARFSSLRHILTANKHPTARSRRSAKFRSWIWAAESIPMRRRATVAAAVAVGAEIKSSSSSNRRKAVYCVPLYLIICTASRCAAHRRRTPKYISRMRIFVSRCIALAPRNEVTDNFEPTDPRNVESWLKENIGKTLTPSIRLCLSRIWFYWTISHNANVHFIAE